MPPDDPTSNPWTLLRTEVKFKSRFFNVQEDIVRFRGATNRPYTSIRTNYSGVCVAPIDHDGSVTLVGQFRYVLDRYTWELPGGGVVVGADPLEVAKAELSEETGLRAAQWLKIVGGASSIGTSDEVLFGYVAWDLQRGEPTPDPEEQIVLRRVPFSEAVRMALQGEIAHVIGTALLLGIDTLLRRGQLPEALLRSLEEGRVPDGGVAGRHKAASEPAHR